MLICIVLPTVRYESVRIPLKVGPAVKAMDWSAKKLANNRGLSHKGMLPIMTKLPATMPAAPRPEMARPRMKTGEFGASAQITEPISKTANATMLSILPS